jgi:hypothetical protein
LFFKATDENGKFATGGRMMKRQHPQQTIYNSITISPIDNYSSRIEQFGGKWWREKPHQRGMAIL